MSVKANENVATDVESTENVAVAENVEETAPENAPEDLVPAKLSPAETFDAMDDANPAKGMLSIARTQLSASLDRIKSDSERLANDSVDAEIADRIESSDDEAVVELRNSRDELEAELEQIIADLRTMILESNEDLHPMSAEEKTEFEKTLATAKAAHKSTLTAMTKALAFSLGDNEAKYVLSDLEVKAKTGGSSSGVAKPRFESASIEVDGEKTEIKGDVSAVKNEDGSEKINLSSGHIAKAINTACGFNAIANQIKPSEITDALAASGYNGSEPLGFDFPVESANKTFKVFVTPKK